MDNTKGCCLADLAMELGLTRGQYKIPPSLALFMDLQAYVFAPAQVARDVSDLAPEKVGRQLLQKDETVSPLQYPKTGTPEILFWASNFSVALNETWHDLTNLTFGNNTSVNVDGSKSAPEASM